MQIVNGTAYNKYMVERFWLGNWMLMAWEKLFAPEGFGDVPEKLKVASSVLQATSLAMELPCPSWFELLIVSPADQ